MQTWVSDLDNGDTSQAQLDADKVGTECGQSGSRYSGTTAASDSLSPRSSPLPLPGLSLV